MRVAAEVNALFSDRNFIQKANFLSRVRGGWERWFQLELKCQTAAEDVDGFLARIEDDIANIPDLAPGNDYQVIALVRGRKEVETLYRKLAANHPGQVERFIFPQGLRSPNGFVSFYQGAKWE